MKLGSLCTGYGGLDLAVGKLADMSHAWHAEIDPDASKVLAAHWPYVPNLGDLTAVDWSSVEPVDVLTAGFPCQPVSSAGQRKGVNDERWLFDDIADAVGRMDPRPRLCVLENVPGLLTANRGHAMARVVQRLASLGYVGRYRTVRASDIGAPHRRERVFVLAWPAADPVRCGQPRWAPDEIGGPIGRATAWRGGQNARRTDALALLPTPTARDGTSGPGHAATAEGTPDLRTTVTLLPTPAARDWRSGESHIMDRNARPLNEVIVNLLPTPRANDSKGTRRVGYTHHGMSVLDVVQLLPTPKGSDGRHGGPGQRSGNGRTDLALPSTVVQHADRWGDYGPAIARWEYVLGRPAPDPTEPGTKGQLRLSPRFVEWLMGLPARLGHGPPAAQCRAAGAGQRRGTAAGGLRALASRGGVVSRRPRWRCTRPDCPAHVWQPVASLPGQDPVRVAERELEAHWRRVHRDETEEAA